MNYTLGDSNTNPTGQAIVTRRWGELTWRGQAPNDSDPHQPNSQTAVGEALTSRSCSPRRPWQTVVALPEAPSCFEVAAVEQDGESAVRKLEGDGEDREVARSRGKSPDDLVLEKGHTWRHLFFHHDRVC